MIRGGDREIAGEKIKENLQTKDVGSPDSKMCLSKDELVISLRQQLELQSKLISHLEEAKRSGDHSSK